MTKRELRKKEAYKLIIKEGVSHQEAFEELSENKSLSENEIAENLSKIPSKAVIERIKIWKTAFITVLAIIILMRILRIALITSVMPVNPVFLALLVLFGLVVPAMGILALVTHRYDGLKGVSFLFIFSIIRSLRKFDDLDPYTIVEFVPYVIAIILGFWMSYIAKTPYKRISQKESQPDGSILSTTKIVFEQEHTNSKNDLLDSGI